MLITEHSYSSILVALVANQLQKPKRSDLTIFSGQNSSSKFNFSVFIFCDNFHYKICMSKIIGTVAFNYKDVIPSKNSDSMKRDMLRSVA